jgi:hypothetical protein
LSGGGAGLNFVHLNLKAPPPCGEAREILSSRNLV